MNRIYSFLIGCIFFIQGIAQNSVYISGKITNPTDSMVILNYWNGSEQVNTFARLRKNGTFNASILLKQPSSYYLNHGNEHTTMFLFPGDSLFITLDARLFDESVHYSGRGAEANNYLAAEFMYFEPSIGSAAFNRTYAQKIVFSSTDTFVSYADSLMKVKLHYLDSLKSRLPIVFYDYLYAEIVFKYTRDKIDYPFLHFYLQGIKDSSVTVDDSYYSFYNSLSFDNEHYLNSYNFRSYLDDLVRYRAKKSTGKTDLTSIELHDAGKQLLKGKIYERFLTDLTMRTMQYGNANEAEELYASANQEITDHDLVLSLTELHRKMMTLNPGNPAPAFTLKDPENKPVSLSDFKGKVVYIDFWASWCGPCRMEMPAARVLQDSFAGKEVVFLYVDIDEDRNEWLKAMKKEQLKGTHVFSQGFEGQMAKLYQINGIPHYFIIGRDGRILDRNAARPSSRDVFKVLNEALAK